MTMKRFMSIAVAGALAVTGLATARADEHEPAADLTAEQTDTPVERSAAAGQYLPLTLAPAVGSVGAVAAGYGGYDAARDSAVMVSYAERADIHVGVDARWRFDLGSETAKLVASHEPTYDLAAGPVAALPLGPVALIAQAGVSAIRRVGENARVGAVALGGVGASF